MNKKCRILRMVQVQSEIYNDISLAISKIGVSHLFFHAVKVFGIEPCLLLKSSDILFSLHRGFLDLFLQKCRISRFIQIQSRKYILKEVRIVITGLLTIKTPINLQHLGNHFSMIWIPFQHQITSIHWSGLGTVSNSARWCTMTSPFKDLFDHGKDIQFDFVPFESRILLFKLHCELLAKHFSLEKKR